jgi:hypothetical protein
MVQGITRGKAQVTQHGTITTLGVQVYYSPQMAANILSCNLLHDTHKIQYHYKSNTFTADPYTVGPRLTFSCVRGHYILDMGEVHDAYVVHVGLKSTRYSKRQLAGAQAAYDFLQRMGYISYKAAAEVVQRGSIKDLGFTRADLVAAQDIYGTPAPYLLGQGTQQTNPTQPDDIIPVHESVDQDLQVDLFFFLGNVFFLSISVLLGLIMVTHLGPGNNRNSIGERKSHGDRQTEGSKAKAGLSLLDHISKYTAKGFRIRRVTSDGEAAVKSVRSDVEALGIELNILGHGSHTPHAESATRILKNEARSTLHSLRFPLPFKLVAALIEFAVHTSNMVPKVNSVGHLPAHTAFTGRVPSFSRDAPYVLEQQDFSSLPKALPATHQSLVVTIAFG